MKLSKFALLALLFISCVFHKREKKIVSLPNPSYEVSLTQAPKNNKIKNVTFSNEGALFGMPKGESSYIQIDSIPEVSNNFNISCWFKVVGENGKISQTLFKILNKEDKQKQLRFCVAGQRLTGSLNSNKFYTKDFSKDAPSSRTYYDLPRLEIGRYYFLSINKIENKVQVYINAELYEEYLVDKDYIFITNSLTFGVLNKTGPYTNQFYGSIRNFELYEQPLNEDEIYSVSVKHFNEIEPFNDAFELSKFNLED